MRLLSRSVAVVCAALVAVGVGAAVPAVAAPGHAQIQGSGSVWVGQAMDVWTSQLAALNLQIVYTPSGSAQGRTDFVNGTSDFGVTDLTFPDAGESVCTTGRSCRQFAYVPLVGGGLGFTYHLEVDGHLVRSLRLSGSTLAGIFAHTITNWADPRIRSDNNGRVLPDLPIIPVVHREGSAANYYFGDYLAHEYGPQWATISGGAAPSAYWPDNGDTALSGSDAVLNYVKSSGADGAIGFVENSYAHAAQYPVAKVENRAGYYILPDQRNVSLALKQAVPDSAGPADLGPVFADADPRAYPLSYYSYLLLPTGADDPRMNTAKRQTLVDSIYYDLCQGQSPVAVQGYAPLPLNLVQNGLDTVATLHAVDPGVTVVGRDTSTCENPTFTHGDPPQDRLDILVSPPLECDRSGHGPCTTDGSDPVSETALTLVGGGSVPSGTLRPIGIGLRAGHIPLAGAPVDLYAAGRTGPWQLIGHTHTGPSGAVVASVRPVGFTRYRVGFAGATTYGAATSNVIVFGTSFAVAAKVAHTPVARGGSATVSGVVRPAAAGDEVLLQEYTGGRWHSILAGTERAVPAGGSDGGFVFTWRPQGVGVHLLRVARAGTADVATGVSATLRLQIT